MLASILLLVQVEYDPRIIQYSELLDVFWASHDSRQVFGQGPDVGTQYRYVVLLFFQHFKFFVNLRKERVVDDCSFKENFGDTLLCCYAVSLWKDIDRHIGFDIYFSCLGSYCAIIPVIHIISIKDNGTNLTIGKHEQHFQLSKVNNNHNMPQYNTIVLKKHQTSYTRVAETVATLTLHILTSCTKSR